VTKGPIRGEQPLFGDVPGEPVPLTRAELDDLAARISNAASTVLRVYYGAEDGPELPSDDNRLPYITGQVPIIKPKPSTPTSKKRKPPSSTYRAEQAALAENPWTN
jgi:hypothetical protein